MLTQDGGLVPPVMLSAAKDRGPPPRRAARPQLLRCAQHDLPGSFLLLGQHSSACPPVGDTFRWAGVDAIHRVPTEPPETTNPSSSETQNPEFFPVLTARRFSACAKMTYQAEDELLPPHCSHPTLKWPDNFLRNPASIKIPRLRLHQLSIDITCIHFARIESDVVGEGFIGMCRVRIVPGGVGRAFLSNLNGIVRGPAFPFAEGMARGGDAVFQTHIFRGNVVNGRVAGLQDAFGAVRIGDDHAVEDDLDMPAALFKTRGTWIIPDGFLAWFKMLFVAHIYLSCL